MKKINMPISTIIHTKKIFTLAESKGWKKWGGFNKKNGSSYQCFRRGNKYIWIGFRYIESGRKPFTVDHTNKHLRYEQQMHEILG